MLNTKIGKLKMTIAKELLSALKKIEQPGSYWAQTTLPIKNFRLSVKNFGPITFPLTDKKCRALVELGRPAKFGSGDQTLLDKSVRDVWEIPKSKVSIDKNWYDQILNKALDELKEKMGLPSKGKLKAHLHNLLIYEPGQFFLPHQDSEKIDGMVASLVMVLPTKHRGGSFVIHHHDQKRHFDSRNLSQPDLNLIAFYADSYHEVKPLKEGYRVVLTFNLSLLGYQSALMHLNANEENMALTMALKNHFENLPRLKDLTKESLKSLWRTPSHKFIYLLDHQYTEQGLSWNLLKNGDRLRALALKHAAEKLGMHIYLNLVDIQETWSAYANSDRYDSYRRRHKYYNDYGDERENEVDDDEEFQLEEMIESVTSIIHWVDQDGNKLNYGKLYPNDQEIFYHKETGDFRPIKSEYEGYMGNYGNTLDRWYHRGALVLWHQDDHYSILLELNPSEVLQNLLHQASKMDKQENVKKILIDLLPLWRSKRHRSDFSSNLFTLSQKLALKLQDKSLAHDLLSVFPATLLTPKDFASLVSLGQLFGIKWIIELFKRSIHPEEKPEIDQDNDDYTFADETSLFKKIADIFEKIYAKIDPKEFHVWKEWTDWILGHQFQTIKNINQLDLKHESLPELMDNSRQRVELISDLLKACHIVHQQKTHQEIIFYLIAHSDLYLANDIELIFKIGRAYFSSDRNFLAGNWGYKTLLEFYCNKLKEKIDLGPREEGDWGIDDKIPCTCEDCKILKSFLQSKKQVEYVWPLAKPRRAHIHRIIDQMRIPVTHETLRKGSPQQLILTKTNKLFKLDKVNFETMKKTFHNLSVKYKC